MNISTQILQQVIPVQLKAVLQRKPMFFVGISIAYLMFVGFLKWNIHPPILAGAYLAGGFIGIYFLDIAEIFFHLSPSPFRSVVFQWLFVVTSFFVVTSSGSLLASGLVLSLYLTMILWQAGEWKIVGNLNSWYRGIATPVSAGMQQMFFVVMIAVFVFETISFIR